MKDIDMKQLLLLFRHRYIVRVKTLEWSIDIYCLF